MLKCYKFRNFSDLTCSKYTTQKVTVIINLMPTIYKRIFWAIIFLSIILVIFGTVWINFPNSYTHHSAIVDNSVLLGFVGLIISFFLTRSSQSTYYQKRVIKLSLIVIAMNLMKKRVLKL